MSLHLLEVIFDLLLVCHSVFSQFSSDDFFVVINFDVNILFNFNIHVSLQLVVGEHLSWDHRFLNLDNWHRNLHWLEQWHFDNWCLDFNSWLYDIIFWRFELFIEKHFLIIFVCTWNSI